jgi:hypothetical protein
MERSIQFKMLLSEDERRMLNEVAEGSGITASDWLRLTLRHAHAEKFGTPKLAKKGGR